MPFNNSVYGKSGKVIGYRCSQCGRICKSMWGTRCNTCRKSNKDIEEVKDELRRIREKVGNI